MTYLVPAACFAAPPEPEGEMGGLAGGTKRKYSYGKHIGQRSAMPSYWVLQAQDTYASNQNTLGENSERKQTTTKLMWLSLRFE